MHAASSPSTTSALGLEVQSDRVLQDSLLAGLSPTFACTVPALPQAMRPTAVNTYLLSRVLGAVDQRLELTGAGRRGAYLRLLTAFADPARGSRVGTRLLAGMAPSAPAAERELLRHLPRLLRVQASLPTLQLPLARRCLTGMARGMLRLQAVRGADGLPSLALFDDYCHYAAGLMAEMLTRLSCAHSPRVARHSHELMALVAPLAQGLQTVHTLKTFWEQRGRGVCWLPRDLFLAHGCDLAPDRDWRGDPRFGAGVEELIARSHGQLREALGYALLLPREELGLRRFCAWPIGMALLTLQRLHRHPGYGASDEVRNPRETARLLANLSRLAAGHDWLLRLGVAVASTGLPSTGGLGQRPLRGNG